LGSRLSKVLFLGGGIAFWTDFPLLGKGLGPRGLSRRNSRFTDEAPLAFSSQYIMASPPNSMGTALGKFGVLATLFSRRWAFRVGVTFYLFPPPPPLYSFWLGLGETGMDRGFKGCRR